MTTSGRRDALRGTASGRSDRRAALATARWGSPWASRGSAPAVVPADAQYRTPSMLFWKTYHQAIREYIQKSILD